MRPDQRSNQNADPTQGPACFKKGRTANFGEKRFMVKNILEALIMIHVLLMHKFILTSFLI